MLNVSFTYEIIYLLFFTFLLLKNLKYAKYPSPYNYGKIAPLDGGYAILTLILSLYIGTRPEPVGSDTTQYMQLYGYCLTDSIEFAPRIDNNPFFNELMVWCGKMHFPISWFFTIIAAIYFFSINYACRKLFPDNWKIAFISYLVAFSTFSYGTDGIKAGAASAVFLIALANKDKKSKSIFIAILSIGFHHSMVMVVYAYLISLYYKNTKYYFYLWVFTVLIAAAHISAFQTFFAGFVDDHGASYLQNTSASHSLTGFRLDFVLYSAAPIYVGYIFFFKNNFRNESYELLLRLYLMTNSVWMLCIYASYTNRIAYLSWFLLPIVLLYPFYAMNYRCDQLMVGQKVAKYHLAFTLFMVVVYYWLLGMFF